MKRARRGMFAFTVIALSAACGAPGSAPDRATTEDALSANLTAPPMGWASWNTFAANINYNVIKQQADAMVSSGMKDAGYQYVNIDEGWWQGTRDSQGNITVSTTDWPGGMSAIATYIHGLGLKAGIYSDAGKDGCGYYYPTGRPAAPGSGSEGHYDQDFLQFSKWGFDYVKVDWCGGSKEGLNAQNQYTQISQSIDRATAQTGRPMVLSVCEWGSNSPWNWAPSISSLWRTSQDIIYYGNSASLDNVLANFDAAQHASAQSAGHYNDPDMLIVGMNGFAAAQNRAHMSLWAISGAPLLAGNNLATMTAETKGILTNREVIAIDQDALGKQGTKVAEDSSGRQVYSKQLSGNGRRAVVLLNRTTSAASITVRWSNLGLTSGSAAVRNVWTGTDLGTFATSYSVSVPARDAVLLLVTDGGSANYTLTVTKAGSGSGTVTGGAINCGNTCSSSIAGGTSVTLTAAAASGSTFGGWSGPCSGTGTCTVSMNAAQTVTATFNGPPINGISINVGGSATGSFVADAYFSGGSTYTTTNAIDTSLITGTVPPQAVLQSERYGESTYTIPGFTAGSAQSVTLYFEESYWSAAGQRTFNVAINGATVLSAFDIYAAAGGQNKAVARTFNATADGSGQVAIQFSKGGGPDNPKVCGIAVAAGGSTNYTLTVSKAGSGSGTVTGGPINCGSTCTASVTSGTSVALTASAASGSTFAGWSGACAGTGACTVSMTAAQTVTATFNGPNNYALTVTKSGTGSGTVTGGAINCGNTCSTTVAGGTSVTLTAAAASGSTFAGWGGACSGTGTCAVTMNAAQTVTATFNLLPVNDGTAYINAGGSATGSFVADAYYSGGSTYTNTNAIDTSQITGVVPPQAVFQSERYGESTYTVPGFTPSSAQTVTLYFEESYWTAAGQRTFNVAINGSTVLSAFDIFAAAGGTNKAIARTFSATANSSGQIVIQFTKGGGPDNPKVCGITIVPGASVNFTLTVSKAGSGSGTVTGGAINCGGTCSASLASGTSVTLTATAASGSTFAGWGAPCSATGTCTITVSAAQTVTATFNTVPVTSAISINAGGSAAGSFVADAYYSGGSTYSTTNAVDTSLVTGTVPPQAIFQSERYGEFTYTVPNLTAGAAYTVTLYFQESYWTAAGQRTFNVAVNGATVLTAFDIYAAAGAQNKAIAQTFSATANSSGQIVIQFTKGGGPDNPKICGITVAGP